MITENVVCSRSQLYNLNAQSNIQGYEAKRVIALATPEERLSRIEGAYEHLATKDDVYLVKADLHEFKAALLREINKLLYWMMGGMLTILVALILSVILD